MNDEHEDIDLSDQLFNNYIIKLNEKLKYVHPLNVDNCVFYVGDIHGSFLQALIPLISAGIIENIDITPEKINYNIRPKKTNNKVIYLGDMFHRNLFANELLFVEVIVDLIESTDNVVWTLGNHDISEYLFHTKYFKTCSDTHYFVFSSNEKDKLKKFCRFVETHGIVAWHDEKNDIIASHTVFNHDLTFIDEPKSMIERINRLFQQTIIKEFNAITIKEKIPLFGWERITDENQPFEYLFSDKIKAIGHTIYKSFYSDVEYSDKLSKFKIMDCDFGCIDSMLIEIAKFYIISDIKINNSHLIPVKSLCDKFDYCYVSNPIELIKF